ncbi:MAG: hemerythrin family protein [Verrucomicrobiales bacterium]|nr:hemerythrin family protein [Verrucomicrobiales bacterium]
MSESMKVAWSEALSTGNRAIDNQHKYLIDIINDVADLVENNGTPAQLKKILNLLQYYTEWHFCNEEECMHRLKCPTAEKNKDAHAQFIDTFLAYRAEIDANESTALDVASRMYKTLTSWLVQHIQGIDTELGPVSAEENAR